MWRSGSYAHCELVREGLGLAEDDELVGFCTLERHYLSQRPSHSATLTIFSSTGIKNWRV